MNWWALGWRPDGLLLWQDGRVSQLDLPAVAAIHRYEPRLVRGADRLYLHGPGDGHALYEVVGDTAEPVVAPAAVTAGGRWRVHRDGTLSYTTPDQLWTRREGTWSAVALPSDMTVRDVDIDRDGGTWCCGSVPSRRIPQSGTEAAVRWKATAHAAWVPRSPRLSAFAAMRTIRQGGLDELRTIDAWAPPVLCTSLCAWFIDDESSFLFTAGARRDQVQRLRHDLIRTIDRSSPVGPRVFTVGGALLSYDGRRFPGRDLRPALLAALGPGRRHLTVRSAAAAGSSLALVVEVAAEGRTSAADPGVLTAICLSTDGGDTFQVAHREPLPEGTDWGSVCVR